MAGQHVQVYPVANPPSLSVPPEVPEKHGTQPDDAIAVECQPRDAILWVQTEKRPLDLATIPLLAVSDAQQVLDVTDVVRAR
jgi:hypothetical protein